MSRKAKVMFVALVLAGCCAKSALADPTSDISKRAKSFCDTKVKLTEQNISFSVEKLITLSGSNKSSVALDSVSVVQIATMRLNCTLLVAGYITPEQFLAKQTEILQFAVDVDTVSKVAEAKNSSTTTKPGSPSTSSGAQSTNPSGSKTSDSSSGQKSASTQPAKDGGQKPAPPTKKPSISIQQIANDLGVTLKVNGGTVQSGGQDYVATAVDRIVAKYSPIPISQ